MHAHGMHAHGMHARVTVKNVCICRRAFNTAMMKLLNLCVARVSTCWANPVPPTWTVILALVVVQVSRPSNFNCSCDITRDHPQTGFGLYPVLVKKFSASSNPLIFSLYR